MEIKIDRNEFAYQKDNIFKPLVEIKSIERKQLYYHYYPLLLNDNKSYTVSIDKNSIFLDNHQSEVKATIKNNSINLTVFSINLTFYKTATGAVIVLEDEIVASVWFKDLHKKVEISANYDLPIREIMLLVVGILNLKSGWISQKTLYEKLELNTAFETAISNWRPKSMPKNAKEKLFEEQVELFLKTVYPSEMITRHEFITFPWLQDTLQYWGDRSIDLKVKCMNHLLQLLSKAIGRYNHRTCNGYQYALKSYKAGLYIYSPDGDYNYNPIGEAILKSKDVNAIIDLIGIIEDSCDKDLYDKYLKNLEHHEEEAIKNAVLEAKERMY